jgi:small subunit ribosomal protein S9
MTIETKYKKVYSSGKRKSAVAKALITEGNGKILYKKKDYKSIPEFDYLKLAEPVRIAEQVLGKINFDASISVRGGGEKGQIDAARLAIAKGIIEFTGSEELREAYTEYDRTLLVADIRRKEAYKPGDSKARAKRQSSKR